MGGGRRAFFGGHISYLYFSIKIQSSKSFTRLLDVFRTFSLTPNCLAQETALLARPFVQCCFPVLRHLLERETEADWIRTELDREFASLDRKSLGGQGISIEQKKGDTFFYVLQPCVLDLGCI